MKFNENLKFLRKKEGLTQEELAEKLTVSRQSVTKWESGNAIPDIEKIKEIAYIFFYNLNKQLGFTFMLRLVAFTYNIQLCTYFS